jgi:hypothetical protein
MSVAMNHVYEINVAKSNFRETYNAGNVDRLLAAFADEFTDMTAGARASLAPTLSLYFGRA